MTWQILIASVWSRHDYLVSLLDSLRPQLAPYMGEVSVLLDRDDAVMPVGMKRNRLLMAATADWTCFADDDDAVAPDYVDRVMSAIRPDVQYVGFRVRLTVDGVEQKPVYHSLRYPEWSEDEHGYYRGISHLNPLRREFALLGLPFQPGFGEDKAWADRVMASGRVKQEVFIDGAAMYEYRYSTTGSLFAGGARHVGTEPVTAITESGDGWIRKP